MHCEVKRENTWPESSQRNTHTINNMNNINWKRQRYTAKYNESPIKSEKENSEWKTKAESEIKQHNKINVNKS